MSSIIHRDGLTVDGRPVLVTESKATPRTEPDIESIDRLEADNGKVLHILRHSSSRGVLYGLAWCDERNNQWRGTDARERLVADRFASLRAGWSVTTFVDEDLAVVRKAFARLTNPT